MQPGCASDVPLVVSVHGGDVLYTAAHRPAAAQRGASGRRGAGRGATDAWPTARASPSSAETHGAGEVRVVHLGTDLPTRHDRRGATARPTLVTVGHLVARKRHADVLRALAVLGAQAPVASLRDRRRRPRASRPAKGSPRGWASADRVELRGAAAPRAGGGTGPAVTLFVMPSTEEAFGVAYIEAMAGGVPAIGCRGEPGPEEIAAAGDGFVLVPPGDIERLTQRIDELLSDPQPAARGRPASARERRRQLHLGALRPPDAGRLRARAGSVEEEARG